MLVGCKYHNRELGSMGNNGGSHQVIGTLWDRGLRTEGRSNVKLKTSHVLTGLVIFKEVFTLPHRFPWNPTESNGMKRNPTESIGNLTWLKAHPNSQAHSNGLRRIPTEFIPIFRWNEVLHGATHSNGMNKFRGSPTESAELQIGLRRNALDY